MLATAVRSDRPQRLFNHRACDSKPVRSDGGHRYLPFRFRRHRALVRSPRAERSRVELQFRRGHLVAAADRVWLLTAD